MATLEFIVAVMFLCVVVMAEDSTPETSNTIFSSDIPPRSPQLRAKISSLQDAVIDTDLDDVLFKTIQEVFKGPMAGKEISFLFEPTVEIHLDNILAKIDRPIFILKSNKTTYLKDSEKNEEEFFRLGNATENDPGEHMDEVLEDESGEDHIEMAEVLLPPSTYSSGFIITSLLAEVVSHIDIEAYLCLLSVL